MMQNIRVSFQPRRIVRHKFKVKPAPMSYIGGYNMVKLFDEEVWKRRRSYKLFDKDIF